ncbi:MAG TPA: cellulase family glycosylhydrolase, partial [Fibrobacteria bacterium]|nr:cellulase family glycosylhydrolase [Fibrobacteria bacterium]
MKKILLALGMLAGMSQAMPAASRVTLPSGKKIFVSGMNLAWINYADDVGGTPLDTAKVNAAMVNIHDSGANAMRIWLSTDGTNDPIYGSNGLVSGPASKTVTNIQAMLRLAKRNDLVLCLTLLTHNWVNAGINATILANNKTMLTTTAGLNAYIANYLTPVVTAIGNDPNLLCWEIFNEPEGMVDGWSSPANTITQTEVQTAVNKIAAAIHAAVPQVLVSNGAASLSTESWYTDAALKAAGGAATGTLDFYMAHYYGWNGPGNSPFTKGYAAWSLDKPLVIGEYASSSWSTSTASSSPMQDAANVDTLMTYLDKAGYAGGMGWQYQQDAGDPWMKGFVTFGHSMMQEYRADSGSILLTGNGSSTFAVSAAATNGGSVTASIAGRVDSGKADTLTAVPAAGYSFVGWSGDTTATGSKLIIPSVVKDRVVLATFTPNAGTNLIKGGTFTAATGDSADWSFYAATNNAAKVSYANNQANVTVSTADTLNYDIQLTQGSITLDSGVTYLLTFDAWSSGARALSIGLSTQGTWHYQGGGSVSLTATKATYTLDITPDSSTTAGILQFNVGALTLPVYVDNVSLVVVPTAIAPRTVFASAPTWSLVRSGSNLVWTRSQALQAGGVVRLVGIDGRELSRAPVSAGERSG